MQKNAKKLRGAQSFTRGENDLRAELLFRLASVSLLRLTFVLLLRWVRHSGQPRTKSLIWKYIPVKKTIIPTSVSRQKKSQVPTSEVHREG